MGYTHYWLRPFKIDYTTYYRIMRDFRSLIIPLRERGVVLAGPDGTMTPILRLDEISFNGIRDCGHMPLPVGVAWPSEHAAGVNSGNVDVVIGEWAGGALLSSRACDGDCSHEPLVFPRQERVDYRHAIHGQCFCSCKTAFKPYDLAVCAFLIVAKHHLSDRLLVNSDGTLHHLHDAMTLCEQNLSYGRDFALDEWPG